MTSYVREILVQSCTRTYLPLIEFRDYIEKSSSSVLNDFIALSICASMFISISMNHMLSLSL